MSDIKYYDIGVNLFCRQFSDPEKILSDALAEGVKCILTGTDMKENERLDGFIKKHDCLATAGIHPHNADRARPEDFDRLRELISGNKGFAAVGECGLDYDRMFSSRENQIRCLGRHIELAEELSKPMFLHERSASREFAGCFGQHRAVCERSVVHCFTGDRKTLRTYLDMGFYIGITGWICDDRRAAELRDAAAFLPPDRVMAETDAPYLTPRNIKGLDRTNVPQNIVYVVSKLAECMKTDTQTLTLKLKENTEKFFGI